MQFDQKDIEAVAASRLNRLENKRTMQWLVGSFAIIIISAILITQPSHKTIGLGVLAVGVLVFIYRVYYQIPNKQKIVKEQLVRQWMAERQGENQ